MFANFKRNVDLLVRSDDGLSNVSAGTAGAVYGLFHKEFVLHGCPYAAFQFGQIVASEMQLTLRNLSGARVSNVSGILCWLLESGIAAERAYRRGDVKALMRALQDLVDGLVLLGEPFEWLLRKCHELMFLQAKRMQYLFEPHERTLADVHYQFGVFLCGEKDYAEALAILGDALPLVRHREWLIVEKDSCEERTLHEAVCCQMTSILLRSSERMLRHDAAKSLHLARQAVRTIDEVGRTKYRVLLCHSHLQFAIAMHDNDQYEEAFKELKLLEAIVNEVTTPMDERSMIFANLRCRMHICLGSCYISLDNQMEEYMVHRCIATAFTLAQTHKMRRCEGEIQMLLAKMYTKANKVRLADRAYKVAELIFREVGNYDRCTVCQLLRAKLSYDEIFPTILEAVRSNKKTTDSMMNMMTRRNGEADDSEDYGADEPLVLTETEKRLARFKTTLPPIVEEDEEPEGGAKEEATGDVGCHGAIKKKPKTDGPVAM